MEKNHFVYGIRSTKNKRKHCEAQYCYVKIHNMESAGRSTVALISAQPIQELTKLEAF